MSHSTRKRRNERKADVESAVDWINGQLDTTLSLAQEEIGRYLLGRFFDGDPASYRSLTTRKLATLQALRARCAAEGMSLSLRSLSTYIELAIQREEMRDHQTLYSGLSPGQRLALMPLRSVPDKVRMARAAIHGQMSVRELEDLVHCVVSGR